MAIKCAEDQSQRVLFLCASKNLADKISEDMPENVHVKTMEEILHLISCGIEKYAAPLYEGVADSIHSYPKYDAIYIDEAQDFTREWAVITNHMLREDSSMMMCRFSGKIVLAMRLQLMDSHICFGRIFVIQQIFIVGHLTKQILELM